MFWQVWQPGLCGILTLGCFFAGGVSLADETGADEAGADKIPLQRIVLFNSGVGFFERRGEVAGDDEVELQFKTSDINDLLKSMVLQDLGSGQVSMVSYWSRDPITKTLQTFAIDLTSNPTLFELLSQIRGRELIVHAPREIRGTMINAESRPQAVPSGEPIKADYINLLTADGMQSFALSSISRIQLADPELEKEFRAALKTLVSAHSADKKTVTLKFLGQGKRPVRVGYVRAAPVWKTSYRLVLGDAEQALLQGWAIVENTGDEDWQNVELSLVSGRPISFQMDLYSPLYATRPLVKHELYAALRPQVYDQDMKESRAQRLSRNRALQERRLAAGRSAANAPASAPGGGGRFFGGAAGEIGKAVDGPLNEALETAEFDMSASVAAVAAGSEVGELFRYDIDTPVSIARQRSAMLPIMNEAVAISKVSIFNQSVHAKHPLNGIRLKNTTALHLMQGPLTLFDGGVYAGDAKIPDLPSGSERLVSYAIDLDVEVDTKNESAPQRLVAVKLTRGVLLATYKDSRQCSYRIKNSADQAKLVLVEHPLDTDWKLVVPEQADETTRNRRRFAVEALPGQTTELDILEERMAKQTVSVGQFDQGQFQFYLSAKAVGDRVKAALQEVQRRRAAITLLSQQSQQRTSQLAGIDSEQSRIRQNMQQLPRDSQLYQRYVKKFTEQEDEVDRLRSELRELKAAVVEKENELQEYVAELDAG